MNVKNKVLANSLLYTFSSLLIKGISFLLLPIYTQYLTPEDYGITNLVSGFIQVATVLISFSLYTSAIRFFSDYKNDSQKLNRFYSTIITFLIISGISLFSISIVFHDIIIAIMFQKIQFYPIVFMSLQLMVFISLSTMHQSILQGMQQGKKLTIINIIVFIITAALKIYFIAFLNLGVVGFLLAQLIVNASYIILMYVDLKRNNLFNFYLDYKILIEALKYSIPLIPHTLSTRIASIASRLFINNNATLYVVGIYSIAIQFGTLIDTIQVSVNRAFQPWFYEMMNNNDHESRKEAVDFSNILLILYSSMYMVIGLFSQEAVIIMTNERYLLAWTVIPILVIGYSIKSIYYFYVNIILFHKLAARKLFVATIIGSLADITLAYILIPLYGMYGASIAFVIAKIIVVTIVVFISKHYNDVGYRLTRMIVTILPSLIFMSIGLYFSYSKYSSMYSWNNLFYKVVIMLIFLLFTYYTNKTTIKKVIKSNSVQRVFKRS